MQQMIDALRQQQQTQVTTNDMGYTQIGGGPNMYGINKNPYLTMRDMQGNLDARFQETMDPTLQGLKDKYSVEGDTKWAELQRGLLDNQYSQGMDTARLQNNTGVAQARSGLAMRGGLRGGGGERLASNAQRGLMSNLQNLGNQNRTANLNLSVADEEMKNKVLGQVGDVGQGIQGRNIGRLTGDIQGQNQFMGQQYTDEMAAYGAKKTADSQRSASCFAANTQIMLSNGDHKLIEDVVLGDELMDGGVVYTTIQSVSDDMYKYFGTYVTGGHATKENGKWIRVKDSRFAEKVDGVFTVYNLSSNHHIIIANEHVFSDFDETDLGSTINDEESLEALNGESVSHVL